MISFFRTIGGFTYGVAKSISLLGVKVLRNDGGGTVSTAIAGMSWALNNMRSTGRPGVLSMSLGTKAVSRAMNAAIKGAIDSNAFMAVSAGNTNTNACNVSPGSSVAMTVGATDIKDKRAYFSNMGGCVDVWAPGVSIWSAGIGNDKDRRTLSGTCVKNIEVRCFVYITPRWVDSLNPLKYNSLLNFFFISPQVNGSSSCTYLKLTL